MPEEVSQKAVRKSKLTLAHHELSRPRCAGVHAPKIIQSLDHHCTHAGTSTDIVNQIENFKDSKLYKCAVRTESRRQAFSPPYTAAQKLPGYRNTELRPAYILWTACFRARSNKSWKTCCKHVQRRASAENVAFNFNVTIIYQAELALLTSEQD